MGDFAPLGIIAIVVLMGLAACLFIAGRSTRNEVKSTKRLQPIRTELVINEGKVDTLFVYKLP